MGRRLAKTVVMVGMMGAGKTAVGQALARRLDVPFRDSDVAIEDAAAMSISEIFARDGEPFFREKEAQIIERLLTSDPAVLSTGGGAWLAERNRTAIARYGISVWLSADLDLLWNRVRHKETRPLLRTADPKATLTALFEERTPVYALADIHVEAKAAYSIADTTDRVVEALMARPMLWTEGD